MYNIVKIMENKLIATADLCDKYKDELQVLQMMLYSYGGVEIFAGEIVTVRLDEQNRVLLNMLKETKGKGRVVVVDVGGSFNAVIGDNLMKFAHKNGWAGIIVNGYVRDIDITRTIPVGLMALGTCPKKSFKINPESKVGVELNFGGVIFREQSYLYADSDGVVVSETKLER